MGRERVEWPQKNRNEKKVSLCTLRYWLCCTAMCCTSYAGYFWPDSVLKIGALAELWITYEIFNRFLMNII